jgi:hypothetical protein
MKSQYTGSDIDQSRVVTETGQDFSLIWILVGSLNEAAN